jgi:hypothetical protein
LEVEMGRKIIIWRVWESSDMAQSDGFFATKKEAENHRAEVFEEDDDTYLEEVEIELTREGIAWALTNLPHR